MTCSRKIGPFDCCSVVQGDCLELMKQLPDGCVDAVITDPPYKTEFIALYGQCAKQSARVLKYGSLFVALAGQFALDRIITDCSKHLRYWWMGGMPNRMGSVACNHSRQMMCSWKPVIWFCNGDRANPHKWTFDLFESKRIDRINHEWEQSEGWFSYYIEKLIDEDGLVLEPFAGSGTTLVAAKKLGRHFLGFEISAEYCQIARDRLARIDAQPKLFEMKPEQLQLT